MNDPAAGAQIVEDPVVVEDVAAEVAQQVQDDQPEYYEPRDIEYGSTVVVRLKDIGRFLGDTLYEAADTLTRHRQLISNLESDGLYQELSEDEKAVVFSLFYEAIAYWREGRPSRDELFDSVYQSSFWYDLSLYEHEWTLNNPDSDPQEHLSNIIIDSLLGEMDEPDEDEQTLTRLLEMFEISPEYGATLPEITSVSYETLRALESRARESEFPPIHSLTTYYRIDMPDRSEDLRFELVNRLNEGVYGVEYAYVELAAGNPQVVHADDPRAQAQGYLKGGLEGVNAHWAWTQPRGNGNNVSLAVVEAGWNLDHEDLAGQGRINQQLLAGLFSSSDTDINHGTAVLGIIHAADNKLGGVGLAPALANVHLASRISSVNGSDSAVADAIVAAAARLGRGDILLIEVESGGRPVEYNESVFNAIRTAVGNGIVVIEAAGNGNVNLDDEKPDWHNAPDLKKLVESNPDLNWDDSGAIVVGACRSSLSPPNNPVGHRRWSKAAGVGSNYGDRVDCSAWGENVVTSGGNGDLTPNATQDKQYTKTFDGTSAASAIIAGAAVLLQSIRKEANGGLLLTPLRIRDAFRDAGNGVEQAPNANNKPTPIGPMPDLEKVMSALPTS